MSVFSPRDSEVKAAWTRRRRLRVATTGIVLLALLVIARVLKPDANGFGTHQQVGLPPCTFNTVFGIRCPSCGMTTSWSYLVRGQFASAAYANAGGTLLGLMAVVAAPWLLVSAAVGRYVGWSPRGMHWVVVVSVICVVTLIHWVWQFAAP